MKIALIQLDLHWEAKEYNCRSAGKYISEASRQGCDIAVLPEMFNTGYSMNVSAIAEEDHGETSSQLSRMARENNINLIAGYAAKDQDALKGRNLAVIYNRAGSRIATYAKLHPFSFAKEDSHFNAGSDIVLFDIEGIRSSIFICYDLRFPEIFRAIAHQVHVIFVIANWPASRTDHWNTLLKARAIENQCFIIGVNRTGKDAHGIDYRGDSAILDPLGQVVCAAGEGEKVIIAEITPQDVTETRARYPFLKDKREFSISGIRISE